MKGNDTLPKLDFKVWARAEHERAQAEHEQAQAEHELSTCFAENFVNIVVFRVFLQKTT